MSNFKAGQKVVYVGHRLPSLKDAIVPALREIVTLDSACSDGYVDGWILKEYQFDKAGAVQGFIEGCFRPLISSPASKELISQPITIEKSDVQIEVIESK